MSMVSLPQPVDDRVGELRVEAGELEDPAGALVDHVADHVLIGVERAAGPGDDAVDQRHVALLGDRRLERLAEQRRDLDPAHPLGDRGLDHAAQPLLVERLEDVGEQARAALAQPALARRLGEEAADRAGDVDAASSAARPPRG